MHWLVFLFTLVIAHVQAAQRTLVWIVNQTSATTPQGQILCQQLIDRAGQPLLQAADDFRLPVTPGPCDSLLLRLDLVAQYVNAWPTTITIWLMRHDPSSGGPGSRFFTAVLAYSTQSPGVYVLDNSTVNRDNLTQRFDLSDQQLLPRDTSLWLGVYAPLALAWSPKGQNALYWRTSTQGRDGHFHYRDPSNLQGWNLTNWTDATVAAPFLSLPTGALQMSWQAALRCVVPVTASPTEEVTLEPTLAPTPNVTNTTTEAPFFHNASVLVGGSVNAVALGVAVPLALLSTACLVGALVYTLRRWPRHQKPYSMDTIRSKLMQMPNAVSSTGPDPAVARTPQKTVDMDFELKPRGPRQQTGTRYVFTNGSEMIDVPLADKKSPFASLLSSSFETTSGDEADTL